SFSRDWSSDVCSSDLGFGQGPCQTGAGGQKVASQGARPQRCQGRGQAARQGGGTEGPGETGGQGGGQGSRQGPCEGPGPEGARRSEERRVGKEWWDRR